MYTCDIAAYIAHHGPDIAPQRGRGYVTLSESSYACPDDVISRSCDVDGDNGERGKTGRDEEAEVACGRKAWPEGRRGDQVVLFHG